MVSALGFSHGAFDPGRPGRLCRGRERWIRAWDEDELPRLHRVVISGAEFSDDSARDARRGLNCAGVPMGEFLLSLFPGQRLIAFREEGELGRIPDEVGEDEDNQFLAPRRGGRWFDPSQRWRVPIESAEQLDKLLRDDNIDGILVDPTEPLTDEIEQALYLLSGLGDASLMPARRFQPVGLVEVLSHVQALICIHLDKHGPAIAIYTVEPIDLTEGIVAGVDAAGSLAVPFAIPPMLARWDRALQELRVTWMRTREDEFPVPPADEPTRWSRLGRRVARSQGEE